MPESVTRTLRIEQDLDRKIQRIAADEKLTVNSLVNKTLLRMVEWDRPGSKVGLVSASSTLLGRLLADKDPADSEDLGRWAARGVYVPFIEFLFGEVSVASVLLLFTRASRYGQFVFGQTADSGKHILILKQTFGANWDYYYGGVLKELLHEVCGMQLTTQYAAGLLVAKLET